MKRNGHRIDECGDILLVALELAEGNDSLCSTALMRAVREKTCRPAFLRRDATSKIYRYTQRGLLAHISGTGHKHDPKYYDLTAAGKERLREIRTGIAESPGDPFGHYNFGPLLECVTP